MTTPETSEPRNIEEALASIYPFTGYTQKEHVPELKYSFASEAALIRTVRPQLIAHGVTIRVAEVMDMQSETFTTSKGAVMNHALLRARVRFSHAPSGTYVDVESIGEGMDVGDKAANKAMTAAYKYAIRQTFCIETGDDPDSTPSEAQERRDHAAPRHAGTAHNRATLPPWGAALNTALRNAGLGMNDIEPVVQARLTQESYVMPIEAWLRGGEGRTVEKLVSTAADMKAAAL